jgi:hypothetical protein
MITPVITILLSLQLYNFIDVVPEIMLKTFKEFPYLYSPTLQEDKEYFSWYAKHEKGMLVTAQHENDLAGFITGIPMNYLATMDFFHGPEISAQFKKNNIDIDNYYYCGEIIVLPDFRENHICSKMFAEFESQVKAWGYEGICLITSDRENDHPLKPVNYLDSRLIWAHYGFTQSSIIIKNVQPTVIDTYGTVQELENGFIFWIKTFNETRIAGRI